VPRSLINPRQIPVPLPCTSLQNVLFTTLAFAAIASVQGSQHVRVTSDTSPIVVNTWPFVNATVEAWRALAEGESAVESVIRVRCSKCLPSQVLTLVSPDPLAKIY
jgi:hypothetical protein